MVKRSVLSIDCGTQSLRAFLIDENGKTLKRAQVMYDPYFSTKSGWAEQKPEVYWNALVKSVNEIVNNSSPEEIHSLLAITLTSQRATLLVVDKNGEPLRDAIIWLDQRKAKFDARIPFLKTMAYKLVGMDEAIKIAQSEAKINWIRQNEPDIFEKAHKFLFLSGYLIHRLTGQFVDSNASQVGYLPFDHKKGRWADPNDIKSIIFPVPRRKLVDLVEPTQTLGKLKKDAATVLHLPSNIPIVASASDKSCETLGVGATTEDFASLSFGTTATIQITTSRYFEPIKYMPAYVAAIPGYYNPEVEIFRGFWMVKWFKEEFGSQEVQKAIEKGVEAEEVLDDFLKDIPPGSLGLTVQPYWTPGLKMPEAKGAIIGFGSMHTRAHVYKAIMEGLGYALLEGKMRIEKAGKLSIRKLAVSGGGAQSDEVCQIISDIFNLPVYRGESHESSSLGAAMDAFVGMKVHSTFQDAIEKMVRYVKVFKPNESNAKLYSQIFNEIYQHMYPQLKPLYKKMRNHVKYPLK
jgi:sugar (pentulose or hexulose) kinase